MASKKKNLSEFEGGDVSDARGLRFGIVTARWNIEITNALLKGAREKLLALGASEKDIFTIFVPGSFELPQGADLLISRYEPDAVICLGCVIQGETRHFDFIAQAVADGCMTLSLTTHTPVIFGVLTTDTYAQALDRSGGKHGNKGDEAAMTAIEMAALGKRL